MSKKEELKFELNWRGILKDIANEENLDWIIENNSKFYIGIDPTANSLHIGHYISIIVSKLINEVTNMEPVFVIGGFSGQIGDPSGKNSERSLIDREIIVENTKNIILQIHNFAKRLNITKYSIFDNIKIYENLSIIDFFQFYGKNFNLNSMLTKDMVKNRLISGISYTEFSYQIFQAIDFFVLFDKQNVRFQIGGSDQWGNIISGIELIRKIKGSDEKVSGLTINLLLDENGNKIGKTGGNAVWLDKNKFSSYSLYQYLLNLSDKLALLLLPKLTLIEREEFENLVEKALVFSKHRILQKNLAKRLIEQLYGEKDYENAEEISNILFNDSYVFLSKELIDNLSKLIPTYNFKNQNIDDYLIDNKILKSKREYREFLEDKAIKVNGISIDKTLEQEKLQKIFENKDFIKSNHKNNKEEAKAIILNIGKKKKILIKK